MDATAGRQVEASAWRFPDQEEAFVVRFGAGGAFGLGASPKDSLRWVGKAQLQIGPQGVRLQGNASGMPTEAVHLRFDEIRDVAFGGTLIRFSIPPSATGEARFVQFDALKPAPTLRILHMLPPTQSQGFQARMQELGEFRARLDACSGPARVTPVLIAINLLVFVAMLVDGAGLFTPHGEVQLRWGSNFGPLTLGGQWWRLLTSAFIHFGLIHIAFNMYALKDLGSVTERMYGRWRFLALYVFAALTSGLASVWWHADPVNAAGASGAIFGVLGGLLAFVINPSNRVPKALMLAHRNSALVFGAFSLLYGAAVPGIDNAAHVGGLLGGFAIGLLLARPVDPALRALPAAPQLAVAALAAALMLGGGYWAVVHPSGATAQVRAYQGYLDAFSGREDSAIADMNGAFAAGKSGDQSGYALRMGSAVRTWTALETGLRAIRVDPASPDAKQYALLLRYVDARRRFCELALASKFDGDDQARLNALSQEAQAAITELNAAKPR